MQLVGSFPLFVIAAVEANNHEANGGDAEDDAHYEQPDSEVGHAPFPKVINVVGEVYPLQRILGNALHSRINHRSLLFSIFHPIVLFTSTRCRPKQPVAVMLFHCDNAGVARITSSPVRKLPHGVQKWDPVAAATPVVNRVGALERSAIKN
jgi:hypothetical protein